VRRIIRGGWPGALGRTSPETKTVTQGEFKRNAGEDLHALELQQDLSSLQSYVETFCADETVIPLKPSRLRMPSPSPIGALMYAPDSAERWFGLELHGATNKVSPVQLLTSKQDSSTLSIPKERPFVTGVTPGSGLCGSSWKGPFGIMCAM